MNNENTLLIGNGFSRVIFKDMPSWGSLFENVESAINNYTVLYEVNLLKDKDQTDNNVKEEIINKIKKIHLLGKINDYILDLDKFGELLNKNNINNIITTNYDNGLELILCEKCGYEEVKAEGLIKEEIYSIRTYKKYMNSKNNHLIKLWKIHGDIDRIKSITLGFDQYCGSLAKLSEYIKGTYKSNKGVECNESIIKKCKNQTFDNISWAELFFNTNVYIIGFGMDFSEIDIWWLLNKHKRIKNDVPQIQNNIFYLYNNKYDDKDKKRDIFESLDAFEVEYRGIDSDENYIRNIFREVNRNASEIK
ncbi:MAG: SIR2 family protein [Oscillospiraceae bacterium]|nr:SIR2 family protein [Oscillospiraceae bacterium]